MRSRIALERELQRCERAQKAATDERDQEAMYGAVQALSWALGQDAAPPSVIGRAYTDAH